MSLVSLMSRIALQRALIGRTAAGVTVLNSPLDAVESLLAEHGSGPLIAIYSGVYKFDPAGRDLSGAMGTDQRGELHVHIYLPPGGVEVEGLPLEGREAGAGVALDLIWRQIQSALADPLNPWAEIYRAIVRSYQSFGSAPVLIEVDNGMSIACREVTLGCKFIAEPAIAMPLNGVWQRIDTALRGVPELVPLADAVKTMIERPSELPSWRITQAQMGWSEPEVRHAGLAPFDVSEAGEAAELSATAVADADQAGEG